MIVALAYVESELEDETMPSPPRHPKIYHITHVENLAAIVAANKLKSDAKMIQEGGPAAPIGMSRIKQRRLKLPVTCYPGDHVGEYVPFYFCSRSVMLYLLHKANDPDIPRKDGQGPIVHLEADLHTVVEWANRQNRKWAFSLSNAGAGYAEFRNDIADLDEIDWPAVANNSWSPPSIKEGKQAEFLVHRSFPWSLVERVGVPSMATGRQATTAISSAAHHPNIELKPTWYY
jgi:hypothetical protein